METEGNYFEEVFIHAYTQTAFSLTPLSANPEFEQPL